MKSANKYVLINYWNPLVNDTCFLLQGTEKVDILRDLPNHQRIFISFTSGAVAGAVAKTVIAPLDRTKIYFQTHPDKGYRLKGAWKFMRLTYTNDGVLR